MSFGTAPWVFGSRHKVDHKRAVTAFLTFEHGRLETHDRLGESRNFHPAAVDTRRNTLPAGHSALLLRPSAGTLFPLVITAVQLSLFSAFRRTHGDHTAAPFARRRVGGDCVAELLESVELLQLFGLVLRVRHRLGAAGGVEALHQGAPLVHPALDGRAGYRTAARRTAAPTARQHRPVHPRAAMPGRRLRPLQRASRRLPVQVVRPAVDAAGGIGPHPDARHGQDRDVQALASGDAPHLDGAANDTAESADATAGPAGVTAAAVPAAQEGQGQTQKSRRPTDTFLSVVFFVVHLHSVRSSHPGTNRPRGMGSVRGALPVHHTLRHPVGQAGGEHSAGGLLIGPVFGVRPWWPSSGRRSWTPPAVEAAPQVPLAPRRHF